MQIEGQRMTTFLSRLNPSFTTKLRAFHAINHLIALWVILYGSLLWFIYAYGVWFIIGCIGITVGFHRLLAHKSFKAPKWFRTLSTVLGSLATGGTPMGWVGNHREHHRSPDQPGDPHSPWILGFWRTYFHYWGHVKIRRRFIVDLLRDPVVVFCHKNYFLILLSYAATLYLLFGFSGLAIGYSIPSVYAFHGYGMINSMGHKYGYRTYDVKDHSTNNWIVNILTFEGWHNNHHNNPNSWHIGERWWEFDPGAWIISLVRIKE